MNQNNTEHVSEDHKPICSVDGCRKEAVAKLIDGMNRSLRCKDCLEFDLDL